MPPRPRPLTIGDLPLFATDEQIGEAVLGWERRKEFATKATYLEARGMPKISHFWGGRHVRGVVEFIDRDNAELAETSLTPEQAGETWRKLRKERKALA